MMLSSDKRARIGISVYQFPLDSFLDIVLNCIRLILMHCVRMFIQWTVTWLIEDGWISLITYTTSAPTFLKIIFNWPWFSIMVIYTGHVHSRTKSVGEKMTHTVPVSDSRLCWMTCLLCSGVREWYMPKRQFLQVYIQVEIRLLFQSKQKVFKEVST